MDWLYPAMNALGAQPSDLLVLNFAVWLNVEEHYTYHLGRCAAFLRSCVQGLQSAGSDMQDVAPSPRTVQKPACNGLLQHLSPRPAA